MSSRVSSIVKPYQENHAEPFLSPRRPKWSPSAMSPNCHPFVCTVRLRDVLKVMNDPELALQPGEIANQKSKYRRKKPFLVD